MNDDGIFADSIRMSFIRLGKNINHMSDEKVKQKSEIVGRRIEELNIDVNKNRKEYLKVVYEVFGV